jgi:hypothetical protein
MREESHLDEMREAIRGDFERLAERRGEQELMQEVPPEVAPAAEQEGPARASTLQAEDEVPSDEEHARRSWLARLFST